MDASTYKERALLFPFLNAVVEFSFITVVPRQHVPHDALRPVFWFGLPARTCHSIFDVTPWRSWRVPVRYFLAIRIDVSVG